MNLIFKCKDLEKTLTNKKECRRQFGLLTDAVLRKLEFLRSASKFSELRDLPGHFHELKYQVKGVFALTVKHPFRLIVAPMNESTILVIALEDYHGRARVMQNYNI